MFENYNPPTVVVPIVPFDRRGILVIDRGLSDGQGKACLPGGFQEMGESWQAALSREVLEETGIELSESWNLYRMESIQGNTKNLLFAVYTGSEPKWTPIDTPTEETLRVWLWDGQPETEWSFPLHQKYALEYWFQRFA